MSCTKHVLRLMVVAGLAAAAAPPAAQAAAPGTKTVTVVLGDNIDGANPSAAAWGRVTSSPAGIDCPGDCQEDVPQASTVTLTVRPARGYVFTGWGVFGNDAAPDCAAAPVCRLTIGPGDAAAVAARLQPDASLLMSVQGAGALTISPGASGQPALPCASDAVCYRGYPTGTRVTLTAVPDVAIAGARFVRWSDYRCPSSGRSCTLTMDGDTYLNAIFEPVFLRVEAGSFGPVAVSPPGVICAFAPDALTGAPAPCRIPYPLGTLATIVRDPARAQEPGQGWIGACAGEAATCVVRMRRDQFVVAGSPPMAAGPGTGQTMRFGYAGPKGGRIIVTGGGAQRTCRRTCTLGGFQPDSRIRIAAKGSKSVAFAKWSDITVRQTSRQIYVGDPTAVRATFKKKKKK
jgi:hypothetical protein